MAATLLATKWGRIQDLKPADTDALADPSSTNLVPGGKITNGGVVGKMGYFCIFNMDGGTDADYTHPFDWPVMGDFTVAINSLAADLASATTVDVSVQGSVDGIIYADLHTDMIDNGAIDNAVVFKTYDYDGKGVMPYMRLEITAATASDESIMINVVPH